ncbi:MAG: hypothetical protein QM296_02455 [Bacillota bacterium]|nr:hypothetical protein [Bacillota bacterium]
MSQVETQTPLEWAITQIMASDASYDDLYATYTATEENRSALVLELQAEKARHAETSNKLARFEEQRDVVRTKVKELQAHANSLERERDEVRATAALQKGLIEKLNQQIASLEAIISCSQHNESLFRKRQDDLEQENTALRGENEELIAQINSSAGQPDSNPEFGPEIQPRIRSVRIAT